MTSGLFHIQVKQGGQWCWLASVARHQEDTASEVDRISSRYSQALSGYRWRLVDYPSGDIVHEQASLGFAYTIVVVAIAGILGAALTYFVATSVFG